MTSKLTPKPKVFISYSWSSEKHKESIRLWAEQLVNDGIDVVLDQWELKEGDDTFTFMERMVNDESVTHVLIFSDSEYAKKANGRQAGVGAESQIISQKVYSQTKQSKFIPIACEVSDSGEFFFPTFFEARFWIDFSTFEAANRNWEQLIRRIYDKPAYEKPSLGKAPSYITTDIHAPASPAHAKFAALKLAILQGKVGLKMYREDFLSACYEYADALRIRERPDVENMGQRVLEDCRKLKLVRDHIVDWILLESEAKPSDEFDEALVSMLEKLLDLKSIPREIYQWNDTMFEAHRVFVYETFLYVVAALLKTGSFGSLHIVLTSNYLLPETGSSAADRFGTFNAFYGYSETLQILAPEGRKLEAPAAQLIKNHADRTDVPFVEVVQAELLVLMMNFIIGGSQWYPQTLLYLSRSGGFPFFVKATRHRDFQKLVKITGVDSGERLRTVVKAGIDGMYRFRIRNIWGCMNMEGLDTIA